MISILTSSLGGSHRVDGKRRPTFLLNDNGLQENMKKYWKRNSNVLVISASPEDWERNDSILFCQSEAFPMSGFDVNVFQMCDSRNETIIENLKDFDVLILAGGHVPTQNAFFSKLDLKKRLENFKGILIS